jgi:predicted RNA-binding Zn-ribbon protein involved in translation (DUF1610 family)
VPEGPPDLIERHIRKALESPTKPTDLGLCPVCGGNLVVRMSRYTRHGREMLGVTAHCTDCGQAVAIDSSATGLAPWLDDAQPSPESSR